MPSTHSQRNSMQWSLFLINCESFISRFSFPPEAKSLLHHSMEVLEPYIYTRTYLLLVKDVEWLAIVTAQNVLEVNGCWGILAAAFFPSIVKSESHLAKQWASSQVSRTTSHSNEHLLLCSIHSMNVVEAHRSFFWVFFGITPFECQLFLSSWFWKPQTALACTS